MDPFIAKTQKRVRAEKFGFACVTCTRIRAIHLDVTTDMIAKGFLYALRRFIARRGKPSEIITDNGLQFILAEKVLKKAYTEALHTELSSKGISWNCIPIASPWMGGFYERMIGIVKSALQKTIGKKLLSLDQFSTILTEVENSVNSRPLCYVSGDIDDPKIITPRHFLSLNSVSDLPILEFNLDDLDFVPKSTNITQILETWKRGQHLLSNFWDIWRKEYLIHLKQNQHPYDSWKAKKLHCSSNPKVGEIVLICDKNQSRNLWNIGMIQTVYKGDDGVIRSCEIRNPNRKFSIRSIQHLYPFEIPQRRTDVAEERANQNAPMGNQTNSYSFLSCTIQDQQFMQTSKQKYHFCLNRSMEQSVQNLSQTKMDTPVLNGIIASSLQKLERGQDELERTWQDLEIDDMGLGKLFNSDQPMEGVIDSGPRENQQEHRELPPDASAMQEKMRKMELKMEAMGAELEEARKWKQAQKETMDKKEQRRKDGHERKSSGALGLSYHHGGTIQKKDGLDGKGPKPHSNLHFEYRKFLSIDIDLRTQSVNVSFRPGRGGRGRGRGNRGNQGRGGHGHHQRDQESQRNMDRPGTSKLSAVGSVRNPERK